jgi:uncharacterized membrane protein
LLKKVRRILITGILVLIPITVTISIIWWVIFKIDSFFATPVRAVTGKSYIGLGIVMTLVIVFIIGLLATNYFGKKIIKSVEKAISKVPIVNIIYSSIKQIQDSIVFKKEQRAFKSAVSIQYPTKGIRCLGFVTADAPAEMEAIIGQKATCVFIPTTPNPTSGMLVIVPDSDLEYLDMSVDVAVKMVVSGGILSENNKMKK